MSSKKSPTVEDCKSACDLFQLWIEEKWNECSDNVNPRTPDRIIQFCREHFEAKRPWRYLIHMTEYYNSIGCTGLWDEKKGLGNPCLSKKVQLFFQGFRDEFSPDVFSSPVSTRSRFKVTDENTPPPKQLNLCNSQSTLESHERHEKLSLPENSDETQANDNVDDTQANDNVEEIQANDNVEETQTSDRKGGWNSSQCSSPLVAEEHFLIEDDSEDKSSCDSEDSQESYLRLRLPDSDDSQCEADNRSNDLDEDKDDQSSESEESESEKECNCSDCAGDTEDTEGECSCLECSAEDEIDNEVYYSDREEEAVTSEPAPEVQEIQTKASETEERGEEEESVREEQVQEEEEEEPMQVDKEPEEEEETESEEQEQVQEEQEEEVGEEEEECDEEEQQVEEEEEEEQKEESESESEEEEQKEKRKKNGRRVTKEYSRETLRSYQIIKDHYKKWYFEKYGGAIDVINRETPKRMEKFLIEVYQPNGRTFGSAVIFRSAMKAYYGILTGEYNEWNESTGRGNPCESESFKKYVKNYRPTPIVLKRKRSTRESSSSINTRSTPARQRDTNISTVIPASSGSRARKSTGRSGNRRANATTTAAAVSNTNNNTEAELRALVNGLEQRVSSIEAKLLRLARLFS